MTNSDATITDNTNLPNVQHQTDEKIVELTPVQEFYKDTNIFITGSTGFLGKILVEKLLRSCQDITTLYLLVRNKKGKNLHTRVDDIFDDIVFDRLKQECPKFRHKIVGIAGDCSLPDLGLSLADRKLLMDKVNIIFHVAATVRFDEKLNMAVAINIRSLHDMMLLAQQTPGLKSMVHVSTAFANCTQQDSIDEKIYQPPIDYKQLLLMTESLPEKIMENITPLVLDKYPNTYAFTKQVAEDVVKQCGDGLPIGIFRPAIVVSTYKEPIISWINNVYGPTGVATGAGIGLLRTLHCDPECNANIVPVDMCVNSLIATAWDVGTTFENARKQNEDYDIPVYQYESSNDNPINWSRFMSDSQKYGILWPSKKAIWYYCFGLYKTYWSYVIATFFLHTIPSLFIDVVLFCMGKQPRMIKIYSKVHKFASVISYFSTRSWTFKSRRVQELCNKLSDKDKTIFFSDLKQLDWDEFFQNYLKGVRVYLIRDSLSSLEEAKLKWNRFYWAHQTLKFLVGFLLLRLLWSLLSITFRSIF